MDLGQDRTHLPAATPASLTARVMRTWSLIDTTDSHLVIVVGNLRKLPGDTHVILASGACLGGTGSTPDRSRSVDDDGGQGSPILYIKTSDRPPQRLLLVLVLVIVVIVVVVSSSSSS